MALYRKKPVVIEAPVGWLQGDDEDSTLAEIWMEPQGGDPPPAGSVEPCLYRTLICVEVCAMTPAEADLMVGQAKLVLNAHFGVRGQAYKDAVVFGKRGCK